MKSEQILKADLLDIIFENRNKAYGAYSIRRAYPSHLKKAMGMMLLMVVIASLYVMSKPKKNTESRLHAYDTLDVNLQTVVDPEKPKEQKQPDERTVPEQPPTKPDFVPVIVDDHLVVDEVPDRTDTTIYNPGAEVNAGTPGGEGFIQATQGNETKITPDPPQETTPLEPPILEHPDENPEFPGGINAWIKYLQERLRVPEELEAGERKTVRVKFVVNANGEVTDAVITMSGGKEFDKEVLRVIGRMPKWKPGKQRGKPVASYFTQPVTFTVPEE